VIPARRIAIGATAAIAVVASARAAAAASPDRALRCGTPTPVARASWPAPLDRRVSLVVDGLSLREALARVSSAGAVRLTYIAELLPLDRAQCVSLAQVAVGDALAALLGGTAVAPVAAGRDQVVLAPTTAESRARAQAAVRIGTLDRVIVTGRRPDGASPVNTLSMDVIDGRTLEQRGATTLASALNGIVPGLWISTPTPGAATVRMASLRGASSFGASAPKVYIDGVEVANPLVLTQLRPETVDRVEVIRGPQGSALYGADAIGGVLQITTRHEPSAGGVSATLRTTAGVAPRDGGGSVGTQDHTLQLRLGSTTRAGGFSLSTSRIGDYVASGATHQWNAAGDVRLVGGRRSLVASARFFSQEAGNPNLLASRPSVPVIPRGDAGTTPSPFLDEAPDTERPPSRQATLPTVSAQSSVSIAPQTSQQYTIGAVLTETGSVWTARVVAGADGYRLANPIIEPGLAGSSADSALRAASGAADRLTLRASASRNATLQRDISATLTIGGEHSSLRDASNMLASGGAEAVMRHSTGLLAKGDAAWGERLFITAGGRVEHNLGYSALSQLSFLPSIGAAYRQTYGATTLTLRSAWGRAIRPPRTPGLTGGLAVARPTLIASLEPEMQSGIESGFELAFGSAAQLTVTRFDQRASGLIQASLVTADLSPWRPTSTIRRTMTALQNVGVIANQGWEFSGRAHRGPAGVTATVSTVSSTVARVVPGYLGDLRRGDRMLDVPALTAGLSIDWTALHWTASVGGSRAANWIGYDRAAIARDLAAGTRTVEQLAGATLRRYWTKYDGVNRLRASFTRDLTPRLTMTLLGENLLDVRVGEPDNLTMLPGRTVSAGLRARF
jgi:iron complex outermembrane recepter protein